MTKSLSPADAQGLLFEEIKRGLALLRAQTPSFRGPHAVRDLRYVARILRSSALLASALVDICWGEGVSNFGGSNASPSLPPQDMASRAGGSGDCEVEVRVPAQVQTPKSGVPCQSLGPRKRGAQPGNSNRLKHGAWSKRSLARRAALRAHLRSAKDLMHKSKNESRPPNESDPANG